MENGPSGGELSDDKQSGFLYRLAKLFGRKPADAADLAAQIKTAEMSNGRPLSQARRMMIERVIAFDQKRVVDVMAPRADIFAVEQDTPLGELVKLFAEAGHSRLPIYRKDLDDPVGMVHIKDVLKLLSDPQFAGREDDSVLGRIRREVLYAPPSMSITDMLLRMQASRIHMALVIDEYGGTDGLVTIEDLVEEIVGEINDEHDDDDEIGVSPIDGGWDVHARLELEEFTEETGAHLETDDDNEIDTVGGYVVSIAGRVPQRGEIISSENGFEFEIVEGDTRRVRRLRIRRSGPKAKI